MLLFVLCSVIYAIQYSTECGINSTFWRFKSNDLLIVLQKTVSKSSIFSSTGLCYCINSEMNFFFCIKSVHIY